MGGDPNQLGYMPWNGHLERKQPYLRDLPTMVIWAIYEKNP